MHKHDPQAAFSFVRAGGRPRRCQGGPVRTNRDAKHVDGSAEANVYSESTIPVIVVAKPGLMCDSLVTFLQSIPGVGVTAVLDLTAPTLPPAPAQQDRIVIVDGNASKDLIAQLAVQRATRPGFRWIVLIDSLQQQRLFRAAGADSVLLKGFLDERLEHAVLAARPDHGSQAQ